MKYYHYFGTESEYNQARDNNYEEPWLSYTEGKGIDYNKPDYTKIPLTFDILSDGVISWSTLGNYTVEYSKNEGSWETMNSETTISVVEGDKVQFIGSSGSYDGKTISLTAQFNIKGNIMSLTAEDFRLLDTTYNWAFTGLFSNCTTLISARDLKLPATTLGDCCYREMFSGCTNMIYSPELPATVLSSYCYASMFSSCSSLTAGPVLPAVELISNCYQYMFVNCTSLNYIKAMFTTTPSTSYTKGWLNNVSSTGTFVKNINAQWNVTGAYGIPSGWTVQTASS